MDYLYQLRKDNDTWRFATEASLEDFIWNNLENIFQLKPLKRQYYVDGNICDILALSDTRQLVIIEIKNSEDRYVIQQLTRYYHAILNEKPFVAQVDYDVPIILNIISPAFHKDNLVDCLYNKLSFNLFQFSIIGDSSPTLKLKNLQSESSYEVNIPFYLLKDASSTREIPQPPRSLIMALARCSHFNSDRILKTREKILKFNHQIQETQVKPGHFIFGKSKTKFVADFITRKHEISKTHPIEYPIFSLRLPISFGEKYRFSRVTLPSNIFLLGEVNLFGREDYILSVGKSGGIGLTSSEFTRLCQKGIGRTQKISHEWSIDVYLQYFLSRELKTEVNCSTLPQRLESYCVQQGLPNANQSNAALLDFLVEVALRQWIKQL